METTVTEIKKNTFSIVDQGFFFVKSGKTYYRILLDDILYFEGEKEYVRIVTTSRKLLIYRRLKNIEDQLAIPFARIHNSYIINVKHLEKVQDNHVYIDGLQISITDKFKERFMTIIHQNIF
jgi:two-component system LytT family response regulator